MCCIDHKKTYCRFGVRSGKSNLFLIFLSNIVGPFTFSPPTKWQVQTREDGVGSLSSLLSINTQIIAMPTIADFP